MSTSRTHIAGVSVAELARQFGTPTFVYDAAMIRRRIADLAAFDVVRYAQKACSNLAILDLVRRAGVLVDTRQRRRDPPRPGRRLCRPRAIRRRSSTRPTSSTPRRSTCASSATSTSTAARPT